MAATGSRAGAPVSPTVICKPPICNTPGGSNPCLTRCPGSLRMRRKSLPAAHTFPIPVDSSTAGALSTPPWASVQGLARVTTGAAARPPRRYWAARHRFAEHTTHTRTRACGQKLWALDAIGLAGRAHAPLGETRHVASCKHPPWGSNPRPQG